MKSFCFTRKNVQFSFLHFHFYLQENSPYFHFSYLQKSSYENSEIVFTIYNADLTE